MWNGSRDGKFDASSIRPLRVLRLLDDRSESARRPRGPCDRATEGRAMPTQPKRLALLLYLALAEPSGLQARDRLLALFWPEADDSSSRHSLRNALHALRQSLGDGAIVTRGESYVGLDTERFGAMRSSCARISRRAVWRSSEPLVRRVRARLPRLRRSRVRALARQQRAQMRRAVRAAAWTRAREMEGAGRAEVDASTSRSAGSRRRAACGPSCAYSWQPVMALAAARLSGTRRSSRARAGCRALL